MRSTAAILIVLSLLSRFCAGDEAGVLFFEKHIRPALIENCYECHSTEAGKSKGGLLLDSRSGWEKGGDIGPAIIPGDVKNSLLLQAMRYGDPDLEMPPKKRLPDNIVEKFEQWIAMGAPDPRLNRVQSVTQQGTVDDPTGYSPEKAHEFWSFQPRKWSLPELSEWAETNIDRFIEEKHRSVGLEKAEPAPPAALLRRAKTDLTGLPPTVAEQDEFLADPSPEKWAEMIDRWLADDGFGERWGRHWLDLARYADTSGGGRAMPLPDAWKFRDFVIDAFNDDMPLDYLMLSHIAGDLLPWESNEARTKNLTATGFLVLGPHNYENQNKALLDLEIADEQIDTIGRAFLGMTIGCARCHDHKFDPIPTRDYYSMAGIFLSSNSVTHSNVSKWHSEPLPGTAEVEEQLKIHQQHEKELEEAVVAAKLRLEKAGGDPGKKEKSADIAGLAGVVIDDTEANLIGKWYPSTSNGRYVADGYLHDDRAKDSVLKAIFSTTLPEAGTYEVRVAYAPGTNRSSRTPVKVVAGKHTEDHRINQRLTPEYQSLFANVGNYYVEKGDSITVTITNEPGQSDGCVVVDAVQILPYDPVVKPDADLSALNKEFSGAKKALTDHVRKKPKIPSVMAVSDLETGQIKNTPIRIRGDEDTHGAVAPRGFLQVASWEPNAIPDHHSGRLELGKWITDPRNPLTSRVMANRVWQHFFGAGIVRSPDNFGTTGMKPSHPELLDYLAGQLIDSGWSVKSLVREIMLSDVYCFDSEVQNLKASHRDPENLYLWRANRRSLDVEVLRDSMLMVSGILDPERGGNTLPDGFSSEFNYQFTTRKRSVYVPVFRNTGYEIFQLFDFANPNFTVGDRGSSSVPTQALYLLNSPEIHNFAREAAGGISGSRDDRIEQAFKRTLGRRPGSAEEKWARELFQSQTDDENVEKWAALYRMLFASIDFRYLR